MIMPAADRHDSFTPIPRGARRHRFRHRGAAVLCSGLEPGIRQAGYWRRGWPTITHQAKPWTRWWWQGSAVEPASLTAQLEAFKAAGLGGVEITPIYGVRGVEDRFIPYLSDAWMKMLDHTLREAARLDLGVDMATGTGWPFGGPWVGDDTSPRTIAHKTWVLGGGERLREPVRLRQTALVRALGNQIHVVNEGAPGDPPRANTAAQQPVLRADARAIQITDLADPVSANKNLQALALEQVKYPRDLPLIALMAFADAGDVIDLTARVAAEVGSTGRLPPAGGRSTRSLPGGTASWSNVRRPVARATSSTTSPATPSATTSRRSIARLPDIACRDCAPSSTTPTRWTTRPVRRTGHRRSSTSSRSGGDTTCVSTCQPCS